jgi:hypothetical protein
MIQTLLARRGYGYGSGMLSPDCQQFIVSIPKNASSLLVDWTTRNKWSSAVVGDNCGWSSCQEFIIVLRDPLERWISGIAQYLNTYILSVVGPNGPIFPGDVVTEFDYAFSADTFINDYNQNIERILFDVIFQFDDHVWPQIDFFENVMPWLPRTYFYLDSEFNNKISSYLNINIEEKLDYNSSKNNSNMKKLQEFFINRLSIRPEFKSRIINAYRRDYELINSVTFK